MYDFAISLQVMNFKALLDINCNVVLISGKINPRFIKLFFHQSIWDIFEKFRNVFDNLPNVT